MANTAIVEARCDIRTLANIYKFFPSNIKPRTKSELIRLSLELLERAIFEHDPEATPITSSEVAYETLAAFKDIVKKGRGLESLAKQIKLERREEANESYDSPQQLDFNQLAKGLMGED